MKTIGIYLIITLLFLSCSDNNSIEDDFKSTPLITKWIQKRRQISNNDLTDSIYYTLKNNKIINSSGLRDMNYTPEKEEVFYTYSNNRLIKIERFNNDILRLKVSFEYNQSNNFKKLLVESINRNTGLTDFQKIEYIHQNDTIYSDQYTSENGINFEFNSRIKTVLDKNNNRVYHENSAGKIISKYDSNQNMILHIIYDHNIYNYTYSDVINSETIINYNTFGKSNIMLLQGEGNEFAPKDLSYNTISSLTDQRNNYYLFQTEKNELNFASKTTYNSPSTIEISEFSFD